eukprot:CAMPEP_0194214202 /NCGR_PEP_ID=MMETSP0156-20130528/15339_1 /TAXON_ID=33649 /ORGANISM="Thalassionema nitzschioides, Strain L26-B" /LENGTH=202 /DNA_ID=CAMNT_0038942421 /DNA_START=123 /DNA_END=731 /DNA_ORIENTATION=+
MKVFDEYEPLPIEAASSEQGRFSNHNQAIQVPSVGVYCKSLYPLNPVVTTIPNMDQKALAQAVSTEEMSMRNAQLSILEDLKFTSHQQSTRANKSEIDLIPEEEITDKDVICERGGKSNRHAGTKRYRGMIEQHKAEYQSLTAKIAKTNLSRNIIAQIQNTGGRFLKKDDVSQNYFVISPVETTKKVSQALREKKILKWTKN